MQRRWLVGTAFACTLVLMVVLAVQKRDLQEQQIALRQRSLLPYVGLYLPRLDAVSLNGDSVLLGATAPRHAQVLVYFTSTCPYCLASIDTWRALADRVREARGTFYAIALDSTAAVRAYQIDHALTYPIVVLEDARERMLFRGAAVPLTVVLDATGLVRHVTQGVFDRPQAVDSVLAAVSDAVLDTSRVSTPSPMFVSGTDPR